MMVVVVCVLPVVGMAQDKLVRLYAPASLTDTGVMGFVLPRFSLKTQIKVQLAEAEDGADVVLGQTGTPVFEGAGGTWRLDVRRPDHAATARFADWLTSEVGQRAITGFAPEGEAMFTLPTAAKAAVVVREMDGDAALGHRLALHHCKRCHVVDEATRMAGIGSTPSFAVLRSLSDWESRFAAFFALNPHPSFTQIEDVTEPFPDDRPPPISPLRMTLDEVEAVLAYVAGMTAADLGAPLLHQ